MENTFGFNYSKAVNTIEVLPNEKIVELFNTYKEGGSNSIEAYNRIVENNLKLVEKIASEFVMHSTLSFEELVSAGNLGLVECVDGYEPSKGAFTTYAYLHIRNAILEEMRKMGNIISFTEHFHKTINLINGFASAFYAMNGVEPSLEEIAKGTKLSKKVIKNAFVTLYETNCTSFDVTYEYNEDDLSLVDIIGDKASERDLALVLAPNDREEIEYIFSCLDDKEVKVLTMRSGFYDGVKRTFGEIAKELGVSTQYATKLYNKIVKKLSHDERIVDYNSYICEVA